MNLWAVVRRIHLSIRAYFVKRYRTQEVLKAFKTAHSVELRDTPINNWPIVRARQDQEISAVRAGKLDIVDRKSWAWPFLPSSVTRLAIPIIKSSPYNLRRCSRTPLPRRAINLIKGAVISQPWAVEAIEDIKIDDEDEQKERIKIAEKIFNHPNNQDSFQSFMESGIEDICVLGAWPIELRYTLDIKRPLKLWGCMIESIRLFPSWSESLPDMPRYAQMTGLKGERGALIFYDDEMIYLKDNPASDSPFGLGKVEVGFQSIISFLGIQDMSGRAGTDQVHKCFPGDTEVLTRRGWTRWDMVGDGEEFATRSKDGKLQWQRALGFVREQHDGDMIQFSNRGLKITVTPNHRMYGQRVTKDWKTGKKTREDIGFIEAKDLMKAVTDRPGKGHRKLKDREPVLYDFRVPATARWEDGVLHGADNCIGNRTFAWEDWAAFLGIWVAEGSCLGHGCDVPPNSDYRIQIAQSSAANKKKYNKIKALLDRMGIDYQAKHDRFLFTDRDIWACISKLGYSFTKFVPQWIKDAPVELIQVFFDWAMLGDGTVRGKKRIYYTASQRLAGDMQELFQKLGSSAQVCSYLDGNTVMYRVEEMLREDLSIIPDGGRGKARMPKRIPYSGMVYCAMVPNGTLYCREQGYAFWTGNTWLWWEQPQSDSSYQIVRRHIQNELEGQAKVSIIGGMKKPDVIEITPVKEEDLLLNWQEMLIRMVANAFDMSAMALGIEHDINRAVGSVLDDKDFRSAVVPMAKRIEQAFTRNILHNKLGWYDLRFRFLQLDDPDIETKSDLCARMYSANALTPNEFREKMGMEDLESPMADLTQAEQMMLNMETMARVQEASQQRMAQQMPGVAPQVPPGAPPPQAPQLGPGSQPPRPGQTPGAQPPPGGQQQTAPGSPLRITPGNVARGGQIQSPKPMMTPKFPILGSKYNARDIARMPVNQLTDVWMSGELGKSPSKVMGEMMNQDPGILEEMTEEVKQFFDQVMQEEQDKPKKKLPLKVLHKWEKDQVTRFRRDAKRIADFATWLQKRGVFMGRPGGAPANKGSVTQGGQVFKPGTTNSGRPGKPGNNNPLQRW